MSSDKPSPKISVESLTARASNVIGLRPNIDKILGADKQQQNQNKQILSELITSFVDNTLVPAINTSRHETHAALEKRKPAAHPLLKDSESEHHSTPLSKRGYGMLMVEARNYAYHYLEARAGEKPKRRFFKAVANESLQKSLDSFVERILSSNGVHTGNFEIPDTFDVKDERYLAGMLVKQLDTKLDLFALSLPNRGKSGGAALG